MCSTGPPWVEVVPSFLFLIFTMPILKRLRGKTKPQGEWIHVKSCQQPDTMKRPAAAMIDSWNEILNIELKVRHGITCFLMRSSLMALRAIGRCGHAIAADCIRQLSVAWLVWATPVEVRDKAQAYIAGAFRDKTQAYIAGALPPREFALSLLNLMSAEANEERQIQLKDAIALFNGGLESEHAAFVAAAQWWSRQTSCRVRFHVATRDNGVMMQHSL